LSKIATVLLVDDDPVILRSHARILDDEFALEMCTNAEDAERRIIEGGVDVVVSDVSMPGMSGFELLDAILARDGRFPVILASAPSLSANANRALREGAFLYLSKPVEPAMFRAAVRLAVHHRRTPRTKPPEAISSPPSELL
jgi:DNA-binding NtrC family response regulator